MQSRDDALKTVRTAHLIYAVVPGADVNSSALVKIAKQEVRSLIRSAAWANGYHLVLRADLGVNVLMLEKCNDHAACAA